MTGRKARNRKTALAPLSVAGLAAALVLVSRLRPARPGPQARHPLHRRRDVGPDGGRGQPLPLPAGTTGWPGTSSRPRPLSPPGTSTSTTPPPETGRPSAVFPVVVHAPARLRRQDRRGAAAGRPRRRRRFPDRSGHGFGLGGDRPGHGVQDRLRQHLLAPGRPSRTAPCRRSPRISGRAPGRGIGVVSTVPFDHATPAAFVSHNPSRSSYYTGLKGYKGLGIADEIVLRTKPDVVIGGGSSASRQSRFRSEEGLHLGVPLSHPPGFGRTTCSWSASPASTAAGPSPRPRRPRPATGRKLFGLFGGKGGNFDVPRVEDSPGRPAVVPATDENPSLAEATLAALDYLGRDPDGFFLVVEQGDIDWANHDNDFEAMIGSVADLDGAVRAALAFVDRPGDGLDWTNTALIVTADHATGGLLLDPGPAARRRATCPARRPGSRPDAPPRRRGATAATARTGAAASRAPDTPRPTSIRTRRSPTGRRGTPTSSSTWPPSGPRPASS